MAEFRVGDKVEVESPKYPGVWTVMKVNPRRYRLQKDGMGAVLNADHTMCRAVGAAPRQFEIERVPVRTLPTQDPGAFVRYTGRSDTKVKHGDVFVVIADKYERVNCAKVGGDGGRYWRFSFSQIEAMTVEAALEALI